MALSPNYGWAEPDNSSLVKNGAQDIRTLGDAIDTSVWNIGFGQAGKNKIINGDFAINQRNFTTTTATGSGFIADRMAYDQDGSGTVTKTYSSFTAGTAPVAGYEAKNFGTIQTTGQSSAAVYTYLVQNIEDVRTFAGQTVTFSFWAKAASGTPKISLENRQNFGSGGSAAVNTNFGVVTLTTSWARYSVTATVPSVSGKTIGAGSYTRFTMWLSAGTDYTARTNSIGIQTNTFDIWGVQAEYGSVATPFQTATGTLQGEIAACQRYYFRQSCDASATQKLFGYGYATTASTGQAVVKSAVTMRTNPTSVDYTSLYLNDNLGSFNTMTTISMVAAGTGQDNFMINLSGGGGGLTTKAWYWITGISSTSFIGFSAELQEMTMDNVTFITVDEVEHAIIDRGDGSFTSMLKSTYEAQQAEQSTPSLTNETSTK